MFFNLSQSRFISGRPSKCPGPDTRPRNPGEVLRQGPRLRVRPPLKKGVDHGRGQRSQNPEKVGEKVAD